MGAVSGQLNRRTSIITITSNFTHPHVDVLVIERLPARRARGPQRREEGPVGGRLPGPPIRPVVPLEAPHVAVAQADPPGALVEHGGHVCVLGGGLDRGQHGPVLRAAGLGLREAHHVPEDAREAGALELGVVLGAGPLQPDARAAAHHHARPVPALGGHDLTSGRRCVCTRPGQYQGARRRTGNVASRTWRGALAPMSSLMCARSLGLLVR